MMLKSRTTRLELADPGWLRIDETVHRVSGAIDSIVRDMENALRDDVVRTLCSNLGILVTGFVFADPYFKERTIFFGLNPEESNSDPETYATEYLWATPGLKERWSEIVHWLFVYTRTKQFDLSKEKKVRTEDFFRHIPKDKGAGYCVSEKDKANRSKYGIHYVTLGEMLLTIVSWRILVASVARGEYETPLSELHVEFNEEHPYPLMTCCWNGIQLLEKGAPIVSEQQLYELQTVWETINGNGSSLKSEWERLRISLETSDKPSMELQALINFAVAAGVIENSMDNSVESIFYVIQRNITRFLEFLDVPKNAITIGEALLHLEQYARFPILPFYVWQALDRAAKCYMVVPVWTTQEKGIEVDDKQCCYCRHLGLALSAVSPLSQLDWTLPNNTNYDKTQICSDSDPVVVSNVIRLIARPLVESNIYAKAINTLKKLAKYKEEEDINNDADVMNVIES